MKNSRSGETIDRMYRGFACWAARRAWSIAGCCPCDHVVLAVERYLRNETDFAAVRAAREEASSGVAGAGQCGAPRCIPAALAQIAAWHTSDDSAEQAARSVIHHTAQTVGCRALGQAVDVVMLSPAETASSYRNLHVWQREPQIEVAARSIEKAFLEGELKRWLSGTAERIENGSA
jgi:hypothetical protein